MENSTNKREERNFSLCKPILIITLPYGTDWEHHRVSYQDFRHNFPDYHIILFPSRDETIIDPVFKVIYDKDITEESLERIKEEVVCHTRIVKQKESNNLLTALQKLKNRMNSNDSIN